MLVLVADESAWCHAESDSLESIEYEWSGKTETAEVC
jgi:hypothetical protein